MTALHVEIGALGVTDPWGRPLSIVGILSRADNKSGTTVGAPARLSSPFEVVNNQCWWRSVVNSTDRNRRYKARTHLLLFEPQHPDLTQRAAPRVYMTHTDLPVWAE